VTGKLTVSDKVSDDGLSGGYSKRPGKSKAVLRIRDLVLFLPRYPGCKKSGSVMNIPDHFPRAYKQFLGIRAPESF
jgi:hypothetical protein